MIETMRPVDSHFANDDVLQRNVVKDSWMAICWDSLTLWFSVEPELRVPREVHIHYNVLRRTRDQLPSS
jgi:hypothetical protein